MTTNGSPSGKRVDASAPRAFADPGRAPLITSPAILHLRRSTTGSKFPTHGHSFQRDKKRLLRNGPVGVGPALDFKVAWLCVWGGVWKNRVAEAGSGLCGWLAQRRLVREQAAQFCDPCAHQCGDIFTAHLMRLVDRLFDFGLAGDLEGELRFHNLYFPVVWRCCLGPKMWVAGQIANQSRYAPSAWLLPVLHRSCGRESRTPPAAAPDGIRRPGGMGLSK